MAYLTTHYPAISHTFIQREVLGLRDRGIGVSCFSLNKVGADTLLSDIDRAEAADTVEIKGLPITTLVATIAGGVVRHPVAMLKTMARAVRHSGLDAPATLTRIFQVGEALVLNKRCRRDGIFHIHAHLGQAPANVAWFACDYGNHVDGGSAESRWSFSFTIHGPQDCLDEPTPQLREKVAAATAVVAVADYTAAQLLRRIEPELWDRVHVVRCGIDVDRQADSEAKPTHRAADDIDGATPTILTVARISPEKGHGIAVEALALLHERGVDARLRLVGPGDYAADIAPLADKLGVADSIDVVGPLSPDAVVDEMSAATVYALPSFAEGLPIVLMEAMAVGCPVVATGISGIPELVEDHVTGRLVPPARADLFADALADLLGDEALRTSLSDAARVRVRELHDEQRQVGRLVDVFTATGALHA